MTYSASSSWVVLIIVAVVVAALFVVLLGVMMLVYQPHHHHRLIHPLITFTATATQEIYTTMMHRNPNVVVMMVRPGDEDCPPVHTTTTTTTTHTPLIPGGDNDGEPSNISKEEGNVTTITATSPQTCVSLVEYALWVRRQLGGDSTDGGSSCGSDGGAGQYASLYTPIRSTPGNNGYGDEEESRGILSSSPTNSNHDTTVVSSSGRSRVVSCSATTQSVDAVPILRNGRLEIEFQAI